MTTILSEPELKLASSVRMKHVNIKKYHNQLNTLKGTLNTLVKNREVLRHALIDIKEGNHTLDLSQFISKTLTSTQVDVSKVDFKELAYSDNGCSLAQKKKMYFDGESVTSKIANTVAEITVLRDFMIKIQGVSADNRDTATWRKRIAVVLNNSVE